MLPASCSPSTTSHSRRLLIHSAHRGLHGKWAELLINRPTTFFSTYTVKHHKINAVVVCMLHRLSHDRCCCWLLPPLYGIVVGIGSAIALVVLYTTVTCLLRCCRFCYCYCFYCCCCCSRSLSLHCAYWSVLHAHCFLGCRAVLFVFVLVLLLLLLLSMLVSVVGWALLPCMCGCLCALSLTWMPPWCFWATPPLLLCRAHFIGVNNANNTYVHSACWHSSWLADTFLLLICVITCFYGLSTRTFAAFFLLVLL